MTSSLPFYLCAMALYWLAMLWVCNQPATRSSVGFRIVTGAFLLWTCALLAGCGGGDPEPEPDVQTPRVNCAQNPEACK